MTPRTAKLTPKQAAAIIGVSLNTLGNWRRQNLGPPYIRHVHRIYYRQTDIETWEANNRVECG
jgi:predicted site-specific integrase-resolvase